jgi:HNH endonuclease
MAKRMTPDEHRQRLLAKTDKNGPVPAYAPHLGPCWLWTGFINDKGYGLTSIDGKSIAAYKFSYRLLVGDVPLGLHLDHLCRVHACVNPSHLEPVTPGTNILRGETFAAKNAAKTHCDNDHEFTEANTYVDKRGSRNCRACRRGAAKTEASRARHRANQARYRARRAARVPAASSA